MLSLLPLFPRLTALGDSGVAVRPPLVTVSVAWVKFLLLLTTFFCFRYNLLRRKFPATSFTGSPVLSDAGFDLLNRLLTYDPQKVYFMTWVDFIFQKTEFLRLIWSWMWQLCSGSLRKKLSTMNGSTKFHFQSRRSLCLLFLLTMRKTGICLVWI